MTLPRSRFGILYVFGAAFLAVNTALRIALAVRSYPDLSHNPFSLIAMLGVGICFDLVTFSYVAALPALYLLAAPDRFFRSFVSRWLGHGLYVLALVLLLLNACSEWFFWEEFTSRYNFAAVDYLGYTHEVIGNIWQSYPVAPILGGIAVVATSIYLLTRKAFARAFEAPEPFLRRLAVAGAFLAAGALSFLFVNASWSTVSRNRLVNDLAMNGLYSFGVAFEQQSLDYERYYPTEPNAEAFARLRKILSQNGGTLSGDDPCNVTRHIVADGPERRMNVLFIVVESLSAKYLTTFGSTSAGTPHLDALAEKSLFFAHCYATGTRTNRGLEAVTLSIPPTPGLSVVNRPNSNDLFSVGTIFRARGYDTKFIYGGYGLFDNMNDFFRGNGFETVDRKDLKPDEVTFANAWGACDEDLFTRMIKECDRSHAAGRRFCSVVLTTSNHRPYSYPAGRIDVPSGTNRLGAVKYTDWAIGDMLRKAESKPWFRETVFVILADHCADSAGKEEVSVAKHHIPVFIYSPGVVEPKRVEEVTSQIDVTPTVLGLLDFSYESRFFGRDILKPGRPRAFVSNYQKLGLFDGGRLTLLMPVRHTKTYRFDPPDRQSIIPDDPESLLDAIACYQGASYLIDHGFFTPVSKSAPLPIP